MVSLRRAEVGTAGFDELADAAASELGYKALRCSALSSSAVEALRAAGVRPFNRADVERYKKQKRAAANLPWQALAVTLLLLGVLVPPVVALVMAEALISWMVLGFGVFLIPLLVGQSWDLTSLEGYRAEVPQYVLETALVVGRELRAAGIKHRFLVDELGWGKTADPFLVLDIDDHMEWLEVWNEPGFGHSRTV